MSRHVLCTAVSCIYGFAETMSTSEKKPSEKKPSEKKPSEKKSSEKKGEKNGGKAGGEEAVTSMGNVITEGGRLVKMEVDYSTTCDEKLPAAQQLAKDGRVQEAVDILMTLEKQSRTVSFSLLHNMKYLAYLIVLRALTS